MKVNRKSWHYKIATIKNTYPSNSLCIYFWQVIGGLLIGTLGLAFMSSIAFLFLSPLLMWFWEPATEFGMLTTVFVVLASIGYGVTKLFRKGVEKASETTFVEVTGAWISAKKKHICPRIDFVE